MPFVRKGAHAHADRFGRLQIVPVDNGIISGQFNRGSESSLKHLELESVMLGTTICQGKCVISRNGSAKS
jgi:hypothetical protein